MSLDRNLISTETNTICFVYMANGPRIQLKRNSKTLMCVVNEAISSIMEEDCLGVNWLLFHLYLYTNISCVLSYYFIPLDSTPVQGAW